MTLIIALRGKAPEDIGGEALIFCSDSRETFGYTVSRVRKITQVIAQSGSETIPLCTVAGSGDSAIIRNVTRTIEKRFKDKCFSDWSGRRPTAEQFDGTMHLIEQTIMNQLSEYRNFGLEISLSLIVGGVDVNGKGSLWEIDSRGIAHKIDEFPGYSCIGSGFVIGGNLLLQQFLHPSLIMDINRGMVFCAYVIDQVSQVDPAVGPFDGEVVLINKRGSYMLNRDQLPPIQQEIKARQRLLQKLFLTIDGARGADNLDRAIAEGLALRDERLKQETAKQKQVSEGKSA
jgi:20S proteasome alpha/beta subunit